MTTEPQRSTTPGVSGPARATAAATLVAFVAIPLVLLARADRALRGAADRRPRIGALLADPSIYPRSQARRVRARRLERPTLITFVRAGCAKCERTAVTLAKLMEGESKGVVLVHAVVLDPSAAPGAPKRYFGLPAVRDGGELATRYGVTRTPLSFLVAPDTRVVAIIDGSRDEGSWREVLAKGAGGG